MGTLPFALMPPPAPALAHERGLEGGGCGREVGTRVQKIGPYQCSGYMNYVHPDGALLRCGFAKQTKVAGKTYKAGDLVCFDPAGKVADCVTFTFDVGAG